MDELTPQVILHFLSDKCTREEWKQINEWLKADVRNETWLFEMKSMWDMGQYEQFKEKDYLEAQFREMWRKIEGAGKRKPKKRKKIARIISYAAAVCLIGVLIGYGLFKPYADKKSRYIVERVTSSDSIRRITLPDKSVIWLNSNSEIQYSTTYGENERKILLSGEAYFEVTPDKNSPFRVETPDFTVKVLGTTFNVTSYTRHDHSGATLISGRVAIENHRGKELMVLHPGQKATYSKATKKLTVKDVDTNAETAWKNAFITFKRSGIKQIIEKLEYIYGEQIILQLMPDNRSQITYSGAVAREDSLENVLKNLQNVIPFHFRRVSERFVISMEIE